MEDIEYSKMAQLEKDNWWYHARQDLIHGLVKRFAGKPKYIIDIGCGNGMVLASIPANQKIGIEVHPAAVANAKQKGIRVLADVNEAPGGADLILLMDVLEHVEEDHAFLARVLAKLAPGGTAIITVPAFQWLWSHHDERTHHFRRYSCGTLLECIQKAGAEAVFSSYWNFTFFLPTFLKKKMKSNPNESDLGAVPGPINTLMKGVLHVENSALSLVPMPFGTSVVAVVKKK